MRRCARMNVCLFGATSSKRRPYAVRHLIGPDSKRFERIGAEGRDHRYIGSVATASYGNQRIRTNGHTMTCLAKAHTELHERRGRLEMSAHATAIAASVCDGRFGINKRRRKYIPTLASNPSMRFCEPATRSPQGRQNGTCVPFALVRPH